jgi:MFS family permease
MDGGGDGVPRPVHGHGTQYAFGVFLAALVEEFGWSRASLSGVFSLYAFVHSVLALGTGRLTDRWGPRTVIAIGGALLGIGPMLMSRVTVLWQPCLLYRTVAALGMSTVSVPCNATVAKWFTRRRGIAVGPASAGGSLGTFTLPPVAHLLVTNLGWRGAYVVFGAAVLVALNGLALLMRRDLEAMGLRPDGAPTLGASSRSGGRTGGWTVAQVFAPKCSGCFTASSQPRGYRSSPCSSTWCRWRATSASLRSWPPRWSAPSASPRWPAAW